MKFLLDMSLEIELDFDFCARSLRSVTDQIALNGPRRGSSASISEQISNVRQVSKWGAEQLKSLLEIRYPGIPWGVEDENSLSDVGMQWAYDAIDGAYHYVQGLPLWAASLSLLKSGSVVASFVYDPCLRQTFVAGAGLGAWIATATQESLRVSVKTDLHAAVVGTSIPPFAQVGPEKQQESLKMLSTLAPNVFALRAMAATSLQLAYVAAGLLDGFCEVGNDIDDWLAGSLLVQEAGGLVTDFDKQPISSRSRGIVAANPVIGQKLRSLLGSELRVS